VQAELISAHEHAILGGGGGVRDRPRRASAQKATYNLISSEEDDAQVCGCALVHEVYCHRVLAVDAHDGMIIQMVGWMRAHDIPIRGRAVQGELHEGDPELQAALRASLVQTPLESAAEEMESSMDAQISSDAVFAMQLHELDEQDGGRRPRKSRRKAVMPRKRLDMDRYANAAWIMIMLAASAEISEICRTVHNAAVHNELLQLN
jgi:hypothetical protein